MINDNKLIIRLALLSALAVSGTSAISSSSVSVNSNNTIITSPATTVVNDTIIVNSGIVNAPVPVQATGKMIEQPLTQPLKSVNVNRAFAEVIMRNNERPRIECDEAIYKDIQFNTTNGDLTYSFPRNKSYAYTPLQGQPLCRIYAQLMNEMLHATNHSQVRLEQQKLHTISADHHAHIEGSIDSPSLTLKANSHSNINVIGNASTNLDIDANHHAAITYLLKGVSHPLNRNSELDASAAHHARVFIVDALQRENVRLYANHHAKLTAYNIAANRLSIDANQFGSIKADGSTDKEVVRLSQHSEYDGSRLQSNIVQVALSQFAHAIVRAREHISGSIRQHSKLSHHGGAVADISCDRFSSCEHSNFPYF